LIERKIVIRKEKKGERERGRIKETERKRQR
jgi:hypothetical protein